MKAAFNKPNALGVAFYPVVQSMSQHIKQWV